jgi:hypothetical protein
MFWPTENETISYVNKDRRAGKVAQVKEHLHSKCEALSSNPSAAQNKQNKDGKTYAPGFISSHLVIYFSLFVYSYSIYLQLKNQMHLGMVAHTCNPSCLGSWNQEDCTSRPAQAKGSHEPFILFYFILFWLISKITRAKLTRGATQSIEHLLCKSKALSSNPSHTKKKKKNQMSEAPLKRKKERMHHSSIKYYF